MNKPEVTKAQLERVIGRLFDEIHATKQGLASVQRAQDTKHTILLPGESIKQLGEDGRVVAEIGGDSGAVVKHLDGPTPAQPETPEVDVQDGSMTVIVDGYDIDGEPAPQDLARTIVHYSREDGFDAYHGTRKGTITGASGQKVFGVAAGTWYVRVQWETLAGKLSEPSEQVMVEVEPPVDAQDIQDTLDAAQERLDEYRDEVAAPRFQALEEGLSENADNLADARTRLASAEQTLSPLPGQVQEARDFASGAIEAAESAEARAVEASNNASNRLQNGGFELGLDHWTTTNVTLSDDAHTGNHAALIGTGGSLMPDADIPVSEGDVWDVSAYAKNGASLVIDVLNAADDSVIRSFITATSSTWSETGRLRAEIPTGVDYLNLRITGDGVLVDDIVLRDVTDVVRLERAATAARQAADEAISRLEVMELTVDGEGGLKDQLQEARNTLVTKADRTELNQLDGKLAQLGWNVTKVWRQDAPPPAGTTYEWTNGIHASESVKRVDGQVVARNEARNPSFENDATRDWVLGANVSSSGRTSISSRVKHGTYSTIFSWAPGATQLQTIARTGADAQSGQWVAVSMWVATTASNVLFADLVVNEYRTSGGFLGTNYRGNLQQVGQNEMTQLTFVYQVNRPDTGRAWGGIVFSGSGSTYSQPSGFAYLDAVQLVVADTEQDARAQIAEYFDGNSPDDRENDLWYDADGVPHFWLKGWGWAVLDDARIDTLNNQLGSVSDRLDTAETDLETALEGPIDHDRLRVGTGAFDEAFATKLIADHATIINAAMRNLSVEEKLLFAEAIGEQIWAELGVFDRLQAREGWIGGTLLEDGAVTAEKIHATREMITKIMGAEWAYIAEQLVVEGEIITNHITAINAALQNLSVTERADFVEAFADQLYADEFTARSAVLARAIIAAPNLIPNIAENNDSDEWWGLSRNLSHPSVWLPGDRTNTYTTPGTVRLEAGQQYHLSLEAAGSVPDTGYALQLRGVNDGGNHYVTWNEAGGVVVAAGTISNWEPYEHAFSVDVTDDYRLRIFPNHTLGANNDGGYQWYKNPRIQNMLDGKLTVPGTIESEHIRFTEELVGNIASLLHLVVDRIDANQLWADSSWQREAYFGSEDADQRTQVDGTGVTAYRRDEMGELIPALQFGGGDFGINWYNETTGEPTGGISNEGDITGRNIQAAHYSLGGRPIFGDPENYAGDGPILDALPKGEVSHGYRNMDGQTRSDRRHWGFLELEPFEAEPGRTYNITLQPFRMGDTKSYFLSFRYTTDGSSPNWSSPEAALFTQAERTFSGSFRFVPDVNGLVRMIVFVYAGNTGITFSTSGSEVYVTVYDEGMAARGLGFVRNATDTNPDHQPLVREYTTGWPITWWQNYGNGQPGYEGHNLLQGMVGNNLATSMFGYQGSVGFAWANSEGGRTIPQALTGATLHSGTLTLRGIATPQINNGHLRPHWHAYSTAPGTMPVDPYPPNNLGGQLVRHGEEARWELPEACLDAIRNGTFGGFSLHPRGLNSPYFAVFASTGASGPVLRLNYTR